MSSRNNFRLWSNLPPRHETMTSALEEVPLDDIRFQHNDLWISTQFDLALASKLPLILSAVLQTTTPGEELARKLTTWFTNFPVHLLEDLYQTTVWGRGTVILPNLTEEKALAFLVNYPQLREGKKHEGPKSDGSPDQVGFVPVLCWCTSVISPGPPGINTDNPERISIIVLVSFDEDVPKKMGEFWLPRHRQDRLRSSEYWTFLDLASALSDWPAVWNRARLELSRRHASMYSNANVVVDMDTTRVIHQDMSNIIALREDLRLFIAACVNMQKVLRRLFSGVEDSRLDIRWTPNLLRASGLEKPAILRLLDEMEHRIQDIQENHQHQQETSEVILRQLENLMSLAFNTQTVVQGQAMASLNVMAALFLPLSFMSSIFGMTQFEISASRYPLAAIVVLALVPRWW